MTCVASPVMSEKVELFLWNFKRGVGHTAGWREVTGELLFTTVVFRGLY